MISRFVCLATVALGLASCQMSSTDTAYVKETYYHTYGVAVSKADWNASGKSGKITGTRRDGVTETKEYEDGVLNGTTTYTFPHSQIVEKKETYANGNKISETWNYPSGTPKRSVEYQGENNVKVSTWYESGTPKSIEKNYEDRLYIGQYYTPENDLEGMVQQGEGERPVRDRYGQLAAMETIENGEVRLKTEYHPNGTPKSVTEYVAGKPEGTKKTYLPSGEPETIETWVAGIQNGPTTIFRNGSKFAVCNYRKGKKSGIEKRFELGTDKVVETIAWSDGMRHGPTESIVENERTTTWYFLDKPVTKHTFETMNETTVR